MSKKDNNELAKKESTDIALVNAMSEDSGQGYETLDRESQSIPHVIVLQKGTPMADVDNGKYIDGAKPGMFFNTATDELVTGDAGLYVIPCAFKRVYIEKDRGTGEYKGIVDPTSEVAIHSKLVKNDKGKKELVTEDGTVLVDTRYHACLVSSDNDTFMPAMIKLQSTQIAKSKAWNTAQKNRMSKNEKGFFNVAPWWQMYKVTTEKETNDYGTWHGFKFNYVGLVNDPELAKAGKQFHNQVLSGDVRVKHDDTESNNEDVPF